MEFIKQHRLLSIIMGGIILIILAFIVLFTVLSFTTETVTEPITFQEKYTQIEGKINNLVVEDSVREGFKVDLMSYTDKVKQEYDMSVDDKDKFMTFARTIDKESIQSKMHVLAFYGRVKKQYDEDVANNFFTPESKAAIDKLFDEYNMALRDNKYREAYSFLDTISGHLSVKINEKGEVVQAQPQVAAEAQTAPGQDPNNPNNPAPTSNATGRAYHPEAKAGDQIVDPINGNTGVVANNGIEVYKLPNEITYSYMTKDEFVQMCIEDGMPERLARQMADAMANEQGLITIGVDEDGTYR